MKFEKISCNKLKVTVTKDDMLSFGISFDSLAENAPEAQDWFWSVLNHAQSEADFDLGSSQLMIEAMSSPDNEIILFLTRLDNDTSSGFKIKKGKYRVKPLGTEIREEKFLYSFESLDHLCSFAQGWENTSLPCSLYSYEDKYFLEFSASDNDIENERLHFSVAEFGTKVNSSKFTPVFLAEHGKLICKDNAIETILKYF